MDNLISPLFLILTLCVPTILWAAALKNFLKYDRLRSIGIAFLISAFVVIVGFCLGEYLAGLENRHHFAYRGLIMGTILGIYIGLPVMLLIWARCRKQK